jgi:hypothetical protein
LQGLQGLQGIQGLQGTTGTTGDKGGVRYTFSTTTTDADPGSGVFRYNNATIASVTSIFIDNLDAAGVTQTAWYDTWDDATNTTRGMLTILGNANSTVNVFRITGEVTVASGYYKIPVAYVSGSLPTNSAAHVIGFSRSGDIGTVSYSPNVINNGGFETWSGGAPSSWGTFWQSGSPVVVQETTIINDGLYALRTNMTGSSVFQRYGSNEFGVTAGEQVKVAIYARYSGTPGATVPTAEFTLLTNTSANPPEFFATGVTSQGQSFSLTTSYVLYEHTFTVPAGHTRARIYYSADSQNATGATSVYFDTASVIPVYPTGSSIVSANNTFTGTNTFPTLRITNGGTLTSLTTSDPSTGTHVFQIGVGTSTNMVFDANDIQVRNNGSSGTLSLNRLGGSVDAGGAITAVGAISSDSNVSALGNLISTNQNNSFTGNQLQLDTWTAGGTGFNFIRARSDTDGTADAEFIVRGDGRISSDVAAVTPADYAEMFEWADGNPDSEDRRGFTVSLIGNQIKKAEEGDIVIGVVSANPAIVADSGWSRWTDKYLTDEFHTPIYEEVEVWSWEGTKVDPEDEHQHPRPHMYSYYADNVPEDVVVPEDKVVSFVQRKILNPDFNPDLEYIPRDERPEWSPIGLVGKLRIWKGQPVAPNWILMRELSDEMDEWLVR